MNSRRYIYTGSKDVQILSFTDVGIIHKRKHKRSILYYEQDTRLAFVNACDLKTLDKCNINLKLSLRVRDRGWEPTQENEEDKWDQKSRTFTHVCSSS